MLEMPYLHRYKLSLSRSFQVQLVVYNNEVIVPIIFEVLFIYHDQVFPLLENVSQFPQSEMYAFLKIQRSRGYFEFPERKYLRGL